MSAKVILVFCAQVVMIQCVLSQCINRLAPELAAPYGSATGAPYSPILALSPPTLVAPATPRNCRYPEPTTSAVEAIPTTSGALPVTSASVFPLGSISVASGNTYEGILAVDGELPFLGTVGFDGVFPSGGSGTVYHACGNSPARITNANLDLGRSASVVVPAAAGLELPAAYGYPAGSVPYSKLAASYAPVASEFGSPAFSSSAREYSGLDFGASRVAPSYPAEYKSFSNPSARLTSCVPAAVAFGSAGLSSCARDYTGLDLGAIASEAKIANARGADTKGSIAAFGKLPVAGETVVLGQVPISGAVNFLGKVPACGRVSISAFCSGGCDFY